MAHTLQTTAPIASPWPLAVRTLVSVFRTAGGALMRALRRSPRFGGVSLSPISSQWLEEHEILSSKHQDNL